MSVLVEYVSHVVAGPSRAKEISQCLMRYLGTVRKDHEILRSLSALVASLPASEHTAFREEFNTVGLHLHPPSDSPFTLPYRNILMCN